MQVIIAVETYIRLVEVQRKSSYIMILLYAYCFVEQNHSKQWSICVFMVGTALTTVLAFSHYILSQTSKNLHSPIRNSIQKSICTVLSMTVGLDYLSMIGSLFAVVSLSVSVLQQCATILSFIPSAELCEVELRRSLLPSSKLRLNYMRLVRTNKFYCIYQGLITCTY